MMALPLRVLRYKSAMQSETRSLRAIWSRVESGIGSPWATWSAKPWHLFWTGSNQAQRVGALARAIMTQYSRYGSAKGTTWAYWERIKSVWKRLWVPESVHVTGICDSCTLVVLSMCASILFIVPLSRLHYASWAYLRSSYVHTALPLRLWCSWLCPRYCSDAFNCFTMHSCYDSTSAWPLPPR